jgi:small subunit ribosomal protein S16
MLTIRLRRTGGKNKLAYRVVVAERKSKRDGRPVEELGHYNPRTSPPLLGLDRERIRHWIDNGAVPSDTVARLIRMDQKRSEAPAASAAPAPQEAPAAPPAEAAPAPTGPEGAPAA